MVNVKYLIFIVSFFSVRCDYNKELCHKFCETCLGQPINDTYMNCLTCKNNYIFNENTNSCYKKEKIDSKILKRANNRLFFTFISILVIGFIISFYINCCPIHLFKRKILKGKNIKIKNNSKYQIIQINNTKN